MSVTSVTPPSDTALLIPGAQFSDAYCIVSDRTFNARGAAELIFESPPRWAHALMKLRDLIVSPFGLKTEKIASQANNRVGFFPVLEETSRRLVAGLDDRHQDFRVIIDVEPKGVQRRVVLTTVVKTHNIFGRTYLAAIMPFHKLIVRTMLRQVR